VVCVRKDTAAWRRQPVVALAHVQDDKVIEAYQCGSFLKKRQALMRAWAAFVATLPGTKAVPIGQMRA
jgi:hypothetical protein